MLRQQVGSYGRRRLSGARLQRRLLPALGQTGAFDWKPRPVFLGVQTVELSLVPSLTVALPEAVNATHAAAMATGATGTPQYQVVMSLYAPNSIPPEARAAGEVRAVNLPDAAETPFNLLVSGMLAWSLSSYTRPPGETLPPPSVYALASDLDAISEYLADPNNWQSAFTYDALAAFMELNYVLQIQTPLGASGLTQPNGALAAAGATGSEVSAAIFPMIPELEMGPKGLGPVQFWNYNCVSRDYEDALTSYYQQLQVATGATGASGQPQERAVTNFRTEPGAQGCPAGDESLSTFIFRDYFAMVAKGAVSGASDLLKAYPYEPTGSNGLSGPAESLRSIAEQFNGIDVQYVTRPGDTLGTIAGRYGISPRRLQVVNPHVAAYGHREPLEAGTTLAVNTGVTPDAIVTANPSYPLQFAPYDPAYLTLSGVKHQVTSGASGASESLADVCAQYGMSGPSGPGSLFTFEADTIPPANPNAGNTSLLQPGAQMVIPAQTFTVTSPLDDSAELVAAFFFVRSLGPARPDQTLWYSQVQFYEQWMEDNPGASGPAIWDVPVVTTQPDGSLIVTGTGQYAPQGADGSGLSPDTRELAAGYFAVTQLPDGTFGEAFQNFASGYVSPTGPSGSYAISDFYYTVPAGATMGGVSELFGVGLDDLAYANAGATGMLQPLSVIALPTLEYPIAEGDTFGSVAAGFDLTPDELADSVENNVGILAPYASGATGATPLTIPDVPGRSAETLVEDMVNFGRFNDVSGMVTNFLLHGMRVPEPGAQTGATFPPGATMWGLYEMTGQQFPVPSGATGPSGQFEVRFTKGSTASWICLDTGPTGPSAPTGPTACGDELVVYLDPLFFANPPSLVLDPELRAGPGALPLYRDTQRQYSISENIHWQSSSSPALPGPTGASGPAAGQPSIWNFPQTLLRVAQGPSGPTGSAPQYELMLANPSDPTGASDQPVSNYSWASAIDVRVQRVPAAGPGQYMPNTYALLGADQEGRDQLLSAWTFLQSVSPPFGQLFILYPPSATSNNSNGLASDSLDPVQTFLLKTNLTTVTTSNQSALLLGAVQQPSGDFYARLSAIPDFLRLAWEASVTGSGGFYLNYYDVNGGGGLPETLFADGDTATITLLLLTITQDNPWGSDFGLYPFNNCAVVGDNIDPGSSRLYVAAVAPDPVRVATVPAGHAGFYLARVNPDPSGDAPPDTTPPDDQTRNLYNLTGYQITGNDYFGESNQGLPVGPADTPVEGVSGPTGPGVWWYQQVLPVYKFGTVNDTPASAALPAAAANPYAGITGASGSAGPLSELDISLAFYDVYGNSTLSTAGQLGVTGPVGYTDDLIGVSSWPAAGADFAFLPGPTSGVVLDTRLSMQLDKYSPTESYPFAQSSGAADADASRYAQVFYQVQQRDLAFALNTNLGDTLIAPDELKAAMTAFVSKAKVFADASASQSQRQYVTNDGDQLGDIAAAYSVTPSMLVAENQNEQVAPLFKGKIVQPVFAVAGPMNTLTLLAAGQLSTPYPPVCGAQGPPDCAGDAGPSGVFSVARLDAASGLGATAPTGETAPELTPTELLTHNQSAPLTPGIVLRTEPRVDPMPVGTINTLAAAATALQSVVYAVFQDTGAGVIDPTATVEIGLYADNFTLAGVVAPNLDIVIDGMTVNTGQTPTFESVETSFASLELDRGDFVVKLENVTGIFAPAAKLTHADFVVPQPPPSQAGPSVPVFNITDLPAGCGTPDFLATVNRAVANFFYAGSALYMSACCYQPQTFDTFTLLAEQFNHITLDQLTQYNTASPLNGGVSLAIPALTYLGDPADAYAPYTPTSADSLDTIGTTFGTTAQAVAALNRYLPGIFAEGATLTLPGLYYLSPLDSLQSVADEFALDFDLFISAIEGLTGLYRTNGVVITPLPTVPDEVGGKKPSFTDVAGLFNVKASPNSDPVTQILTVNRSLEEFLLEGASLAGPSPTVPITAGAHDTVGTILSRFQREQGIEVSITQLAAANASTPGLLTTGRPFLLPPNSTEVASALSPVIPPEGVTGEDAIVFPVSVGVDMTRPPFLVAPDFLVAPPVYQNSSAYSPRGTAPGATTMSLTAFATEFEAAFKDYRLKCAVVQKDAVSDPQQAPQLYAVNFGETGVSRCAVDATAPQFYSLAPLSTELLTGTLPVRPYLSDCGLGDVVYKKFDAVDLDNWMGQFLNTVDLFLSAPYAVPAFQLGGAGPSGSFASAPEFAPTTPADGPVGLGGFPSAASSEGFFQTLGLGATGDCTGGTGIDGPSNYDDIVASKYQLAGELKTDVLQILQVAGPTGGDYYDGVAQETLYQQMLVRLSDAYNVNAVVQYTVDVESPLVTPADPTGASGPIPPRLSGQVVPDLYAAPQTPPGPTGDCPPVPLQDAAPYFGVSLPYLAETIGGMQGLLQAGATAQYNTKTYTIQSSDTLNVVAAQLGVPADPTLPGYWETWTPFATDIAAQALIVAGGIFSVVKIARQVYDGDTIETIAEFFGTDAAVVGEANQSLAGILNPGDLTILGYETYSIQPGDTLLSIAAGVKPSGDSPPLTVATLSEAVSRMQPLLNVGETLYLTQALPDVTLSTAKVSLGRVGDPDGLAPPLSFLFSLKNPRQHRKLFLNLKYVVNEMEFDIDTVPDTGGYQSSSWLTFVLPIGSGQGADVGVETSMGQVQIPIPLRSYPVPPTLVAQSGLPTEATAPTTTPEEAIAQGKRWDYRFDFQSTNAAQDSNHVQVSFNLFGGATGPQLSEVPTSRTAAVFGALAEFIDAAPSLVADLALLTKQPNQTAAIAVSVLDTFAASVANALGYSFFGAFADEQWPTLTYLYKLQSSTVNHELAELQMTLESGPTGSVLWPQVFIQSLTAPTAGTGPDAGWLQLTPGPTGDTTASFNYPAGFPVNAPITQRFLLEGRDVIQNQNASGGIYLTRNDDLIASGPLGTTGPSSPTGPQGAVATNDAFLYETPLVSFINRLTPFISDPTKIDVSALSGPSGPAAPPRTLAQHIENMLDAVLELGPLSPVQADSQISILCSYGFPISGAGGPGELVAVTPIRLVPAQTLTPDMKTYFAYQLSESILAWPGWPGPSGPGELIFDLSAFTTAGSGGATGPDNSAKPILEFEYLRVPLAQILPE
jgi:LysM repeat protein